MQRSETCSIQSFQRQMSSPEMEPRMASLSNDCTCRNKGKVWQRGSLLTSRFRGPWRLGSWPPFEPSPETSGVWITGLRYHANLFGTESASKMQYRLNMLWQACNCYDLLNVHQMVIECKVNQYSSKSHIECFRTDWMEPKLDAIRPLFQSNWTIEIEYWNEITTRKPFKSVLSMPPQQIPVV